MPRKDRKLEELSLDEKISLVSRYLGGEAGLNELAHHSRLSPPLIVELCIHTLDHLSAVFQGEPGAPLHPKDPQACTTGRLQHLKNAVARVESDRSEDIEPDD